MVQVNAAAAARRHGAAFAIYVVIGGLSALGEWAVFWLLLHFSRIDMFADAAVAFIVATFVNYLLCVRTIYVSKTGSTLGDIVQVYLASLLAFGVNLATLAVLSRGLGVDPMLGKIAGTGVALVFNFAARQFVIFAPGLGLMKARLRRDAAE